jgi:hypothetical protein
MVLISQREQDGYREVERFEFGPQSADISRGRIPDGGEETAFMSPTPGASNVVSGVDAPVADVLRIYPNPFSQGIYVDMQNVAKPYRVQVFNATGRHTGRVVAIQQKN